MKYTFQIVAALLVSLNVCAQHAALTVPDFTFFKSNKTPFTNKDLEQNKILFFVFFDAGCEHCQHAVQTLNAHYSDLKNTLLYLISLDSQEAITNFMNKYGKNLSGKKNVILLQDLNDEFISKFGPRKYPSMFLYSPEKKLIIYNDNEDNLFRFFQQINAQQNKTSSKNG
jgi:peroxiredoxin